MLDSRDLHSFPTRRSSDLARSDLASGTVWYWFATINFLHFAALLFALCSGILIAVSLLTAPPGAARTVGLTRSEEHTSELQSLTNLVCRLLLEKKKNKKQN